MEVPLPVNGSGPCGSSCDVGILPREQVSDVCMPLVPESLGQ